MRGPGRPLKDGVKMNSDKTLHNYLSNAFCKLKLFRQTKEQFYEDMERDGKPHVEVSAAAYWRQLNAGRHFLHEHPAGSESWDMESMQELADDPRVLVVEGPMCRWGLQAHDSQGVGFVLKQTRWMTSSPEIAKILKGE